MLGQILHDVVQIQHRRGFHVPRSLRLIAAGCLVCTNNQAHVHQFRLFHLVDAPTCGLDQNKRGGGGYCVHIFVVAEVGWKFKVEDVERLIFALTAERLALKEFFKLFVQTLHSVNRRIVAFSHFAFLPACSRILDTSCCNRSCKMISLSGSTSSRHTVLCIALADGLDMV